MKRTAPSGGSVDAVFPDGHTGNTVPTLTVKITKQLRAKLVATAKRRGVTQSELVRDAIETSLRAPDATTGPSLFDQISDLIGVTAAGPPDLSTNKKYLEGLGLDGPAYRKQVARDRRRAR
jgi:hypothetical protein